MPSTPISCSALFTASSLEFWMTASTLVMMLFSCSCSRKRDPCEHNPAPAHSTVCRPLAEIETIYRAHQHLLLQQSLRRPLLRFRRCGWLYKLCIVHRNILLHLA